MSSAVLSEASDSSPRRVDSEAPKSGIRVSAKGATLGGLGPAPSDRPPRPSRALDEVDDTYVEAAAPGAAPEAPSSRPGRAAVRPRPSRPVPASSSVRLAPPSPPRPAKPTLPPPALKSSAPKPAALGPAAAPALASPPAPVVERAEALADSARIEAELLEAERTEVGLEPEIPAPTPSSQFRSLTTTAQDWPVAKVPDDNARGSAALEAISVRMPTFGSPPPGAPNPSRFSMPAFLPPKELVTIRDQAPANDADRMDLAFESALDVELPVHPSLGQRATVWAQSLPRPIVLAIGVTVGVLATLIAR